MIDPIIKVRVPKTLERKEVQRLVNTESGSYEIHQAGFGRSSFEVSPSKANGNGHGNGSVANFRLNKTIFGHGRKSPNPSP